MHSSRYHFFLTLFNLSFLNIGFHQAASGVTASYDALDDLFQCVGNFLNRLRVYTEIPATSIMTDIIVKILVEVLAVLALATRQIKQGRFSELLVTCISLIAEHVTEKFAKKLLGESEIEAVLQRLDRLTQDEARMTVAQTLEVVYSLISNVKVIMDGTYISHNLPSVIDKIVSRVEGRASTDQMRQALGMLILS